MQGNRVDSRLLVVGSQTANLISNISFGHNLCFRCPNGWCEPILDIYVLRAFQWYKEIFNPLIFDPYNRLLKSEESTEAPTPKVETPLGAWGFIPSHFLTLPGACDVIPKLPSWLATLQALALVTSSRLGLRHIGCTQGKTICQLTLPPLVAWDIPYVNFKNTCFKST